VVELQNNWVRLSAVNTWVRIKIIKKPLTQISFSVLSGIRYLGAHAFTIILVIFSTFLSATGPALGLQAILPRSAFVELGQRKQLFAHGTGLHVILIARWH